MKEVRNTITLLAIVLLMCVSAVAQADVVHHEVCDPTYTTRGFKSECWEDTETGKIYSDEGCSQELVDEDLAKVVIYASLPQNPIENIPEDFRVCEFDHLEIFGITLNWAAETTYYDACWATSDPRDAKFTVANDCVNYARLVWTKNQGDPDQGRYTVNIYVNDEVTFSLTQEEGSFLEGVFVQSLPGLKKGDVVTFEVIQVENAAWREASPTFKASLEYTFALQHEACDPTPTTRGFTSECWEDTGTGAIYSDPVCTQELTGADLARTVVYSKLPESPVTEKTDNYTVVGTDHLDTYDVTLNWAAETTYDKASTLSSDPRYAKFVAANDGVHYARLVWAKDQGDVKYGTFTVKILVNDDEAYSLTQDSSLEGVFVQGLPGLKKDDVVTFQVVQDQAASDGKAKPTFRASLEYTYYVSDGIYHAVCDPTLSTRGFTRECWEMAETGKYYSDMECKKELTDADLAKTVIYSKLPKSPIKTMSGFNKSDTTQTDWGVDLNWAAVATVDYDWGQDPHSATFQVANVTPSYARLVWNRNQGDNDYGKYTVSIYVNGDQIFTRNQDEEDYEGVFVQPLPDVKAGDEIKFEVTQYQMAFDDPLPTFKASLEYAYDCDHTYPEGRAICSICGYIKPHEHNYVDYVCTLCDAQEPGILFGYVGRDADQKNIKWVLDIDAHTLTFSGSGKMEDFLPKHCGWLDDKYRTDITKLVIEEGITNIGDGGQEDIDEGYFSRMSGLNDVSLPSTLDTIGGSAFYACWGLDTITFPEGLLTIADWAFEQTALEEIVLPASVTYVGMNGLSIASLKKVTLIGSPQLETNSFAACSSLTDFYLMNNTPVDAHPWTFQGADLSGTTLHVNNEVIDWALVNTPWTTFGKVKPFSNISYVDGDSVLQTVNFDPEATDNTWALPEGCKKITVYEDIPMQTLSYTRNFSTADWQALYVPFTMQYEDWSEDFEVARLNDVHQYDDDDDGVIDRTVLELIKLKDGSSTEPHVPYVFKAREAGEKTITVTASKLYVTEENSFDVTSWYTRFIFTGTYNTITDMATKGHYAMAGGELKQAKSDAVTLAPLRWYLDVTDRNGNPDPANARRIFLSFDDGETTEVTSVEAVGDRDTAPVHSISGVNVSSDKASLPRGLYVSNGKKFIIR